MWPPEAIESRDQPARLDDHIAGMHAAASDVALLLTADHGMNYKKRCWDLNCVLNDYEMQLPLLIWNQGGKLPTAKKININLDLILFFKNMVYIGNRFFSEFKKNVGNTAWLYQWGLWPDESHSP